jgi:hypothetical protein
LYFSAYNVRVIESCVVAETGHVAPLGETRSAYKILERKSERILGDMEKKNNNIKIEIKYAEYWGMDWNSLSHFTDVISLKLECT